MATLHLQRNQAGQPVRYILKTFHNSDLISRHVSRGTARFNRSKGIWTMPVDPVYFRNIQRYVPDLEIDQEVIDHLRSMAKVQNDIFAVLEDGSPLEENDGLWGQTQRAGVRFLTTGKKVILALDMGIGKTVIACYALRHVKAKRAVVVCPNSVKWSWVDHLRKWTKAPNIVVVDRAMTQRQVKQVAEKVITGNLNTRVEQLVVACKRKEIVLVLNYDQLRLHKDIICGYDWDVIIADEAHRIKNPRAQQTVATVSLSRKAAYVWMLTGTPARNKLTDLWQPLNVCDPHRFSGFWNFVNYHFETFQTRFGTEIGGLKYPEEFNAMLSRYMYRKTKKEALPDLPDVIYKDIKLSLNPQQAKVYQDMEKRFMIEVTRLLEDGREVRDILFAKEVLSQLIRLRQICLTPALLGSVPDSAKLDALSEVIDSVEGQFIVFTCFRQFIPYVTAMLERKEILYGTIVGGQSASDRMDVQRKLTSGDIRAIVGTTQSMGEGMNLQAATTAIFCDTDWVPAVNSQAVSRIHRGDIKVSPVIITLYHPGTVEADIRSACKRKDKMIDATVGQIEVVRSMLQRGK